MAGSRSYDETKVEKVLKDAGFGQRLATLPEGIESILYKDYEESGIEISGGEAQKLAIARALYKNAPFLILDEPTAALDPIAEYKMFETITELCKGEDKLSIIVSHRLSSAAMCEKIFVFEYGKLLEQGSHNELLEINGTYAYMFHKQARNYQAKEVEQDA